MPKIHPFTPHPFRIIKMSIVAVAIVGCIFDGSGGDPMDDGQLDERMNIDATVVGAAERIHSEYLIVPTNTGSELE